jgi:hypothetical protein
VEGSRLEEFALRVRGADRTSELDSAAVEVLDAFDAADVPCVLLKGVVLSRLLYASHQERGYSDVDVLIPPSRKDAAGSALTALGYENTTAAQGVEDVGGAVHADTWVRRNQRIGPLMIDLHARLAGVNAPPEEAWPALTAGQLTIELCGRRAPVLSREGLALHLATHAAQHGPDDAKPLASLSYGLANWPPAVWRGASELAREVDAVDAFAAGLRLVPEGARLAAALELPETSGFEWEMRHRDERPRGTFHLRAFADAAGWRERLALLRRALVPSREWLEYEEPRARDSSLWLAIARLKHLLRTPAWALRALVYRRRARRAVR